MPMLGPRFATLAGLVRLVPFFLIVALFATAQASNQGEKKPSGGASCPLLFSAVPLQQYLIEARKYELTRETLKQAEHRMLGHATTLLKLSPQLGIPGLDVRKAVRNYSGAVSMRMRVLDRAALEFEQLVASDLGFSLELVQSSVRKAAEDPVVYRSFSVVEFIHAGAPSIEGYLLHLLMKPQMQTLESVTLEHNGKRASVPFVIGPRQVEMVRTVLQYSLTKPGDAMLEIGYGTPAVSLGVAFFTRSKVLAVDPQAVPLNANSVLAPYGVELVRGYFPTSSGAGEKIQNQSPYSVIFALDALRKGEALTTRITSLSFVKAIYNLLAEGGTAVILNDFMGEPNFTREEAVTAGFTIVRWGFKEELPEDLIKLMPYPDKSSGGQMALYVLRKGDPSLSKGRLIEKRTEL